MSARLLERWTDLKVLVAGSVAVTALFAALLYLLCLRPLAADAAAGQLGEAAALTQEGLAGLGVEQEMQFAADLQRRLGYQLLDDALAAPRLIPPVSAWLRSVGDSLQRQSQGALRLKTDDAGQAWINIETDERRYWLTVPADRLGAARPLWLSLGIGLAAWLCLLAVLLELRRRSRNVQRFSQALRHVGIGDVARLLPETGSGEERDFSAAFNTMVKGLQQLDSENRLLLGAISHDLRTPLTSMRLGLELAKDEMEPGLAASLYQDAADLESILNQFLDYARDDTLEAPEEGDLNQLILEIAGHLGDRGHGVDLDLGPLPVFKFRKLAMRRLITNLLNNAVNYAGVGVGARTRALNARLIEISVVDGGPGLDEAQLQQLLRPFVRGTQTDNRHPGSGLGLTIASRIARIHGGTLHLSNRLQGGLEARIEMPVQDEKD